MRKKLHLDWPATLILAAVLTAWAFVLADSLGRSFEYVSAGRHLRGAFLLYALTGTALGMGAFVILTLEKLSTARLVKRAPRLALPLRAAFYGLLASALCGPTAFWTFSGARVQGTTWALFGPYVFLLAVLACVSVCAWLVLRAMAALERDAWRLPMLVGAAAVVGALLVMRIDLTFYVALYTRLHTLLECAAALLLFVALTLLVHWLTQRFSVAQVAVRAGSLVAVGWTLLVAVSGATRESIHASLRHVWLEEGYVGRGLRRFQDVEDFIANPGGWRGLAMSRVERLEERFDVSTNAKDALWDQPLRETPEFAEKIREVRGPHTGVNIVVFYVDTLRYDAASDPQLMPTLAKFSRRALNFRNAYSSGSDTLRALPGLTSGSFDFSRDHPNDLLAIARRSELVSVLFIAQSAHEFLAKQRPAFRFEQTVRVPDYPPEKTDVWGYGADGPTAGRIVDHALEWLKAHKKERSLLWLFNFDQHNWRELDNEYVATAARKYGVPDNGALNWRYRVIARAIDAEFARFLRGLDELQVSDRTIVLFVSDHGEALGRDGFWVHSVFLWESLVRVPLLLRIPGLKGRNIDEAVSLVDVAPTLARYIEREPLTTGYMGEDLLGYLVPGRPPRRLPLLLSAVNKDQLLRVGLVDPQAPYKLVISLEAAVPELYDLKSRDPDAVSIADREPDRTLELLSVLVRSPIFPRSVSDLGVPATYSVSPRP